MPEALHSRPARIVVLDDDPSILSLLQEVLQHEGYEVYTALQHGDVPALVKERQPDLVIVDLMVSGRQDGMATLEQLKQDASLSRIPVLVCSAATAVLDRHEAFLNGHNIPIIRKPFDLDELLDAVHGALETDGRVRGRATGRRGAPDVDLQVPRLRVDELTLDLDRLQAQLSLDARVANLLTLTAGADVSADGAALALRGVDGDLSLQVRLGNVAQIIGRTLQTLDRNPGLMGRALSNVTSLPVLSEADHTNGQVVRRGEDDGNQSSEHQEQGEAAFAVRADKKRTLAATAVEGRDARRVHRGTTSADHPGRHPGEAWARPEWEAAESHPRRPLPRSDHRGGRPWWGDDHLERQARDAIQARVHALQRRVARLEAVRLKQTSSRVA